MSAIAYRDFLPQEKPRGGLFGGVDFSDFDTCVAAMNEWLAQNPVEVIRVETVTLPNIHNISEMGSTDTELHTTGHAVWYQFVRVWYS
ncbi:MAG: hypothetical protein KDI33_16175 [Halioglobus sp.]|nr:hypothetical protein [Halioglobus sp.]